MGCSDSDDNNTFPPASTLSVEGATKTTDPHILQAIDHASASLKQAGVSQVRILDYGPNAYFGHLVEIRPVDGNKAEVNASLDAISKELRGAGLNAGEGPAFRCPDSPMEVQVILKSEGHSR